ncbi:hypothetical protein LEP1GSC058_3913 [Leptospira fainei serovar Hurstbridge str. BUT 6]|uniref:Uncharacterized protein n=1 Tax=Leptospira fainei serovar Hurstbridge str. BUT 6 TaxID=1193011 RepID=S3UX40_9LEPT|nr:hypothetical protein LEP1GSC058_3913 [Leptospira fainei serovar Hurstbridge str. BUT 6]
MSTFPSFPLLFARNLLIFFSEYEQLERKEVRVEEPEGPAVAKDLIVKALELYRRTFPK